MNSNQVFEEYLLRSVNDITILRPNIIVQSGLEGEGKYFYCTKEDCTINLKYEKKHENEACRWRFYPGTYTSDSTRERCNPGYVSFPEGIFELSLIVYQDGKRTNSKKLNFYVYNTSETRNYLSQKKLQEEEERKKLVRKIGQQEIVTRENFSSGMEQKQDKNIHASIALQGKLSKEKSFSGNTLDCSGVERCYVNLEAIIEGDAPHLSYIWKQNSKEFSTQLNPKGIWIDEDSRLEFLVFSGETLITSENFTVNLVKKTDTSTQKISPYEPLLFEEVQPQKQDSKKAVKFTQNFLVLKYDGLRISGSAPVGSRVELYKNGEKFIVGETNTSGKYRLVSKDITVGEHYFDTKLILSTGEEIFFEKSGMKEIIASERSFWYSGKKVVKSSQKSLKIPQLVMQVEAEDTFQENEVGEKMTLSGKICMSILVLLTFLIAGGHLFFRQLSYYNSKKPFLIDILSFSTRQKVLLLIH